LRNKSKTQKLVETQKPIEKDREIPTQTKKILRGVAKLRKKIQNRDRETEKPTEDRQTRTDGQRNRDRALVWKRGRSVAANLNLQDAVVCVVSTHPKVLRELFFLRILAQG
jgi:hypothetical protein